MARTYTLRLAGDSVFKFPRKVRIKAAQVVKDPTGSASSVTVVTGTDFGSNTWPPENVLSGAVPQEVISHFEVPAGAIWVKQEMDFPVLENTVISVSSGAVPVQLTIEES